MEKRKVGGFLMTKEMFDVQAILGIETIDEKKKAEQSPIEVLDYFGNGFHEKIVVQFKPTTTPAKVITNLGVDRELVKMWFHFALKNGVILYSNGKNGSKYTNREYELVNGGYLRL